MLSLTVMGQELINKPQCIPFKKEKLNELFGKDKVSFIEFMKVMNSRQTKLTAGKSLKSAINSDQYHYGSEEKAMKLFKMANGLRKNKFKSDKTIVLPYCFEAGTRELASIGNIETSIDKEEVREPKTFALSISAQYGNLDVESSDGDISMQFLKASAGAYYKINDDYFLTSLVSAVQFRNIEHTETNKKVEASDLFPEFGVSAFRKFDRLNVGAGYDFLQYFVRDASVAGVSLNPSATHRASAKVSYSLTDSLVAFANLGYLKSFEENNISGVDTSVGVNYSFGKYKAYSVAPVFYKGSVERDSSEGTDSSTVLAVKFGYSF